MQEGKETANEKDREGGKNITKKASMMEFYRRLIKTMELQWNNHKRKKTMSKMLEQKRRPKQTKKKIRRRGEMQRNDKDSMPGMHYSTELRSVSAKDPGETLRPIHLNNYHILQSWHSLPLWL